MAEHIRFARNRREFLTDCFCGFGSLAFASMLAQDAGARRRATIRSRPSRRTCRTRPRRKRSSSCYMAGGPSHLETFDPKPLLNKLDGQKRPAEFGDVKYQNVNSESRIARHQADLQEIRQVAASKFPTCSRTRPRSSTTSA